jgi:putative tryptophan/tyrosine transport system substrate-binding protein
MRRRDLIKGIAGSAIAWPLAARAQQPERMRRVGILMGGSNDPLGQGRAAALVEGLGEFNWHDGGNLRIDWRWAGGNPALYEQYAAELIALDPEVLVVWGSPGVGALRQQTSTIPIVLVNVTDPVGQGFVESLAHPGGNATGFSNIEFSQNAKMLELLKETAPHVTRVAVLRDPFVSAGSGGFAAIQTAAASFGVELTPVGVRDADEIKRGIAEFARGSNEGLIVVGPPSSIALINRKLIAALAVEHQLPAVYATLAFISFGGLVSYGVDPISEYRRAADYVDRILKGEKPADLSVQAPTKYTLVINLKTAKALGLTIPQSLIATADEVIE